MMHFDNRTVTILIFDPPRLPMQNSHDCLNCGSVAHLNYCPNCGQGTRLHVPSAGEFIHEFVAHYIALEGKLWKTLKLLFFKPGMLTVEYIAGRRASYVEPLRIFLTFSILFFATLKLSGTEIANFRDNDKEVAAEIAEGNRTGRERPLPGAIEPAARQAAKPDAAAPAATSPDQRGVEVNTDFGFLGADLEAIANKKMERFNALPRDEQERMVKAGFYSYTPYLMLLLMPVFALYLKLLYLGSGRTYGEHFLFALHTNAFAYMQITLILLSPWGWLTFAFSMWLMFYLPTAMRRVYGGSRKVTFLRWMVLGTLHAISLGVAMLAAIVLPALL